MQGEGTIVFNGLTIGVCCNHLISVTVHCLQQTLFHLHFQFQKGIENFYSAIACMFVFFTNKLTLALALASYSVVTPAFGKDCLTSLLIFSSENNFQSSVSGSHALRKRDSMGTRLYKKAFSYYIIY